MFKSLSRDMCIGSIQAPVPCLGVDTSFATYCGVSLSSRSCFNGQIAEAPLFEAVMTFTPFVVFTLRWRTLVSRASVLRSSGQFFPKFYRRRLKSSNPTLVQAQTQVFGTINPDKGKLLPKRTVLEAAIGACKSHLLNGSYNKSETKLADHRGQKEQVMSRLRGDLSRHYLRSPMKIEFRYITILLPPFCPVSTLAPVQSKEMILEDKAIQTLDSS